MRDLVLNFHKEKIRFKKKIFYEFLTQNNLQIFVIFAYFVNIQTLYFSTVIVTS